MFNKNLKTIRLTRCLSQKQVADYLNISPQSISKWEKGETLPSIAFLPQMAECFNCEINDFFISDAENLFDLEMLKDFFAFMTERICEKNGTTEDFIPFIKQYPNICEVLENLGKKMKQHQVIKTKTLQKILDCTEEENALFIQYFIKHELIEKIDTDDSYFVIKSNFDGLVMVVKLMIETCELIGKSNQQKAGV